MVSTTAAANNPTLPAALNQPLPRSQADWQQILNQLSTWQSTLQTIVGPIQQTAAEIAAGVTPTNYAYNPFRIDIRRFGADPTGVVSSDAAIAAAIKVANAVANAPVGQTAGGATIWLPAGKYLFTVPWPSIASGITFEGDGSATGGSQPGTLVQYNASSGDFINLNAAGACQLRRMQIQNTNAAFSANLVNVLNCIGFSMSDVSFNATVSAILVYAVNLVGGAFERVNFIGGNAAVIGGSQSGGTNGSTTVTFRTCTFLGCTGSAPVANGGTNWVFNECAFEALSNGKAGAFANSSSSLAFNVVFRNCWFGDLGSNAGSTAWITFYGANLKVDNCTINGDSALSAIGFNLVNAPSGCEITNCIFASMASCVQLAGSGTTPVVFRYNYWVGCTTSIANASLYGSPANSIINPNFPMVGAVSGGVGGLEPYFYISSTINYDYNPNNGKLRQSGTATFTRGTGTTITFRRPFSTGCTPVLSLTLNSGASPFFGSLGTTSFFVNCSGGSGTQTLNWTAEGY